MVPANGVNAEDIWPYSSPGIPIFLRYGICHNEEGSLLWVEVLSLIKVKNNGVRSVWRYMFSRMLKRQPIRKSITNWSGEPLVVNLWGLQNSLPKNCTIFSHMCAKTWLKKMVSCLCAKACQPVHQSNCLSIDLSIYRSAYLSRYLSIDLFIYLSIYLPIPLICMCRTGVQGSGFRLGRTQSQVWN